MTESLTIKKTTSSKKIAKSRAKVAEVITPAVEVIPLDVRKKVKGGNLVVAHRQWADRPADERFWSIDEMHARCLKADQSRTVINVPLKDLQVNDMLLDGKPMTNWAFSQLARRIDLPGHVVQRMPSDLASDVVNWGIRNAAESLSAPSRLSICDGAIESIMTDKYSYIPNHRICDGLRVLEGMGWKIPPARPVDATVSGVRKAEKKDITRNSTIKVGDLIAPAGLYASDRDMFAFLVHDGATVDDGTGNELRRGIFVSNSEVGAAAFKLTCFLYDHVCGNHIVWGATNVVQARVTHLGSKADGKIFGSLEQNLAGWTDQDGKDITQKIRAARRTILGENPKEVYENLVSVRKTYVTRHHIQRAWDLVEQHDKDRVDVRTVWGLVTGYTRVSQELKNTDDRVYLEDTVARIMNQVRMN